MQTGNQFCLPLFRYTAKGYLRKTIRDYIFHLHDRIIEDGFYRSIEAHPERQALVEVACAAEGLNDAYSIALEEKDERIEQYREALCTALSYLLDVQCVDYCTQRERGGFGYSLADRAHRQSRQAPWNHPGTCVHLPSLSKSAIFALIRIELFIIPKPSFAGGRQTDRYEESVAGNLQS